MAKQYEIEGPDKRTYTIEVPDNATDADAIGYVKHLVAQEAAHQEKTGFMPAVKTGLQSGLSQLEQGAGIVAESTGFPEMAQSLKTKGEETAKKAQEASEKTTEEDVAAASKNGLIPEYLAKARKNITEPAGETIGRVLPVVAASATGNPLAIGAAGAGEYLAGAGHISELGGSNEAALTGAAPIAAINTLGAPAGLIPKYLAGKAGASFLENAAKNTLTNAAIATPAAIASEDIARSAADKPLMNKEEMLETGKNVLTVAPLFGAGHAALSHLNRPAERNPLIPDHLASRTNATTEQPAPDNIPEPTVRGKPAETDLGVVHDTDSLARNFDVSKADKKNNNLWGIREVKDGKITDGFAKYDTLDEGLEAINGLLGRYATKHNIDTPIALTKRYAPAADNNNPERYAKHIADHLGLDNVNDKIDLTDPNTRSKVIWAIMREEGVVHPNKNVQGKSYTPGEKPVVEGQATAEQPAPAMLTPEQIRDQLGLGEKHPAFNTLKDLDLASEEGLADAESVLNGLKETAGRKESIAEDKVNVVDDIINQLKTKPDAFKAAQDEVDNLQKAHEADPTPENLNKFSAAKEQLETTKKAANVDKAFDEVLGEPEAIKPTAPKAMEAVNPLTPEHLRRGASGGVETAEADLLSNPSTVVRDPAGKLSFTDAVKNTFHNFGKNQVDKWLGLTKINEKYGDYVGDELSAFWLGHAMDKMGTQLPRVLAEGGLKLTPDGQSVVTKAPIEMHDGTVKNASVKNMLDHVKGEKDGQDILHEILWTKDQERMQKVNPENVSLRVSKDPEGFAKKVQNVDTILKNKPVYQDALNMLKEVNRMRVDYLKDTGTIDEGMYSFFKDQDLYVPNYTLRDEATDMLGASGKKITIGNTATRSFRERTQSDHDINPMENIANEMIRSYMGGARNHHKMLTAEQLQKVGKASFVGRTNLKEKQGNFGFLKNGKRQFYELHDPTDYPVMEILSQSVNPIMLASRGAAQILRTAVTNTPNFWKRQLFIDPIGATMTSDIGWITPAHTMYEITKILRGDRKILNKLMDAGAISHVDPTIDPRDSRMLYKEIGTRTVSKSGLDQFKSKLRHNSEFMHILVDGATRCAVYQKAYDRGAKKGMSPEKAEGYALMKAREAINFSVSGNSDAQRTGRQLIPFLGAGINALELMRRNITMGHVKVEDRPAYRRQFMNKVYTIGMLSGLHALYMSGDPDYEEAKNSFKYSRVVVPTGDKDNPLFGLDLPPDMTFLYWIPALMVDYSLGTKDGQEIWKIAKDQMLTMIPGQIGYTGGVPVPQIAKTPLELAMGKSFYTGEDIVSKADQGLPAGAQGQYTASKTGKAVGKALEVSPTKVDYLFKGYLGELGNVALWASDGILDTVGLADNVKKPDRHWTQTPGLGAQGTFGTYLASQSVEDMYVHKEKADQARKLYNQLGTRGEAGQEDFKNFKADPDNIKLVQLATEMDRYAKHESDIMKKIHMLQNSNISSAEMTRRIEEAKRERTATAQQAEKIYAKVMGK